MSMVGYVDWSDVEVRSSSDSRGDGENVYLKFGPGKFKVRCIGKPYFFLQTFISKKITGSDKDIAVISPGDDKDPLIRMNINPQQRGAMSILHRDDDNKLKIMRFGAAIYKHIKNYAVETGIDPADIKKGIDLLITVVDPGGNPRQRQYSVTPLNPTPLTKSEADAIKNAGGLHELDKIFAPTSLEKINEIIVENDLVEKTSKVSGEDTDFEDSNRSKSNSSQDDSDSEEYSF